MKMLAEHIAEELNIAAPVGKIKTKAFCIVNFMRLQNYGGDVRAAVLTAQKAFIARIGVFKRTMKTLLRIVNDQFGMWSMKFRMCFVINGLLNFAKHFANDHTDCPRFVWWTQCSDSHIRYQPTEEYCTRILSDRSLESQKMIPLFFTLFVKAFIMSPYMESQLWKCLWFSKTTICESYFHWKGIMIPKWGNVTPSLYERKEASALIGFVKRQQDKKFLGKKLVKSKYAATLTVASAQKNSRYERYVLEAITGICGVTMRLMLQ